MFQSISGQLKSIFKIAVLSTLPILLTNHVPASLETAEQKRSRDVSYNAYDGELYYSLPGGQTRVFSIDRY